MRAGRFAALVSALLATSLTVGCAVVGWDPTFQTTLAETAAQTEVERLLALKPKQPVPARVLLFELPSSGRSKMRSPLKLLELRKVTGERMRRALEGTGIFRSVDFLPEILLPSELPVNLRALRIAAARMQADAILVYSTEAGYESKPNNWCALYLTLIGAFFAPGTDYTSMAVSKAVLLDVPTGYIYFAAQGYGTKSARGPVARMDAEQLEYDARLTSLTELSADVARRVTALGPGSE